MNIANLKLFIRDFRRNKLYSGITVLGFAAALTFVVLLTVYIRKELTVDDFHVNKDRIVHLANDKGYGYSGPMAALVKEQFPEVEDYCLFMLNKEGLASVSPTEKINYTYAYASPVFFRMFSFPLSEGDPAEVLQARHSMVISESLGRRLFGNESPVGKVLENAGIRIPITGVMKDIPENTHFPDFDAVINIQGLTDYWHWPDGDILEAMGIATFDLYLLEKPGADLESRNADILASFRENVSFYQQEDAPQKLVVEPLDQIYFSSYKGGFARHNSKSLLWVLSAIVGVILLLAVINYINLTVARGGMRAKEISVKKLLGSSRARLFMQFITDSVIMCLLAFILACIFSVLAEPVFNRLMGAHIQVLPAFSPLWLTGMLLCIVGVGTLSGLIPAWIITRFDAVEVMKGAFRKKTKGSYSKILISLQYTAAIVLTICTIVLVKQTHFMVHYDMGFNRDNLVRYSYVLDAGKKDVLKNEVKKLAGVKEVAFTCGDPLDGGNNSSFDYEGRQLNFRSFRVDTAFFRMLGLKTISTGLQNSEGGTYSYWVVYNGKTQQMTLRKQSVWLNREALRQLELDSLPLEFKMYGKSQAVRGIVDDFHIYDLSQGIAPLMISPLQTPETPWNMWVQLQGPDQYATFHEIGRIYKRLSEGTPFKAAFVNDAIHQWYERTERISGMIGNLCMLALLLSAMGILAMATYFIQQRLKEIGIRRVNGATIREILRMLIGGFMKWIVLAFVIACPLGYYIMTRWLSDFAYRTTLDWWVFALSGGIALSIAALMICWQSWRAASSNPVEVLKSE